MVLGAFVDLDLVEEVFGESLLTGDDREQARLAEELVQAAEVPLGPVIEVLRQRDEVPRLGVQQEQVVLDRGEVRAPRASDLVGFVVERFQVLELEPTLGLGLEVRGAGALVGRSLGAGGLAAPLEQQPAAGDVDAHADDRRSALLELPDRVGCVLVGLALHAQAGDVVDDDEPGPAVVDEFTDSTGELGLGRDLGHGLAVEVQDRPAQSLHRHVGGEPDVDDRDPQVPVRR